MGGIIQPRINPQTLMVFRKYLFKQNHQQMTKTHAKLKKGALSLLMLLLISYKTRATVDGTPSKIPTFLP